MTRYADPQRCPDCSSQISAGAVACPSCGLSLRGDLAQELFVTLHRADDLLVALRARSVAVATAGVTATAGAAGAPGAPGPAAVPVRRPRPRLGAVSVPRVLLGLGATCLLVAALVFLAYAWSVLGVAGRTAVLLGFTAVAGALAAWGARRGLRAAAEALTLVALGLLTLDGFGARSAGWLGNGDTSAFVLALGLLLAVTAGAAARLVRRTPARALTGAELVAVLGAALVGLGVATLDGLPTSPALVLAVLTGVGATAAAHALRLTVATAFAALLTGVEWLVLTGVAVDRVAGQPGVTEIWGRLEVWPLLVAAALAASVALLRRRPRPVRVAGPAVGVALVAFAAVLPALDETPTAAVVALLAVLVVAAGLCWVAPRPWGLAASLTQGVAGLVVATVTMRLLLAAAARLGESASQVWGGAAADRLPAWQAVGLPAAWLLPLCVLALVATAFAVGRATPPVGRLLRVVDVPVAAGVALLTAVATLALYPVPVWAPVTLLAAAGLGCTAGWLPAQRTRWLVVALLALAGAVVVSLHAEVLTLAALVAAVAGAGLVHLRARAGTAAEGAGLLLMLSLAGAIWTGGALLDLGHPWVALADLLTLATVCLVAPAVPTGWWASPADGARVGLEVGAATAAVPVAAAGVLLAPAAGSAGWAAVYLTVAGAVVTAMALLRRDRRTLGWAGGALLALASWVRLGDLGVHQPEAYTLPSAAALVVVGMVHLRRHPGAATMPALSAGLGLGLVPSLLWALDDPSSLRALLLGVGCFGLVVAGVRLRWTAPVVWGAAVGGLLVLRLAGPYLGQALPRWVLIGAAGAALISMGVTWERRLADARHVVSYVRSLR